MNNKEINYQMHRVIDVMDKFSATYEHELLWFCFISAFILVTTFYVVNKEVFIETPVVYVMVSYIALVGISPLLYYFIAVILSLAILTFPLWGVIWGLKTIISREIEL